MSKGTKTYINPGVVLPVIGGYSEALMHCKHAGRPIGVELVRQEYSGQVYHSGAVHANGNRFTGFTTGEVGILQDEGGFYVYVRDENDKGDADPAQVQKDMTELIVNALGGR